MLVAALLLATAAVVADALHSGSAVKPVASRRTSASRPASSRATARPTSARGHRASTSTPSTPPTPSTVPLGPAIGRRLRLVSTVTGAISPKSVDATGTGLVFAQNMMYRHTMTVYDRDGRLVKTIPDGVDLTSLGYPGHPGVSQGAPVEGAVSPDHRFF